MKKVMLFLQILLVWLKLVSTQRIDNDEHRSHHSNYRVSHHMGQMKIKANPEGADFDFSGGDLHVDLHPAHSDIVPIFNYFHSDYHHYDVQPVEHHIEHDIEHHHSGDDHHEMEMEHGEDEEGYTRTYGHHHEHHCHQHQQMDPYEHHHLHHHRLQDNDQRQGQMSCMHDHSGDYEHHHMMENDHEEMTEDHGHNDMPHVFPVGLWHLGEGGGHHGGGGGGHHGGMEHDHTQYGNEGSHQYVGGHHEMEGNNIIHPGRIGHHREESWGDNMGHYGGGDYGGQTSEHHGGEDLEGECSHRWKRDRSNCTTSMYVPKKAMDVSGEARDFLLKPVSLDGSIRNKFKKHWNDEENEQNGEKSAHTENDEGRDENDNNHQHHHHHHHPQHDRDSRVDEAVRLNHHHQPKSSDDREPSRPDGDAKPASDEFIRNHNFPKKIYPENDEGSGGTPETVESEYKINDKLSEKEARLGDDIEREERKEKLRKDRESEEDDEKIKDNVEKDIERKEQQIQKEREKEFTHKSKDDADDDNEGPDDPQDKTPQKFHKGELQWNKEEPVEDRKQAHLVHHPGSWSVHKDSHHEEDEDKEAEEHEKEEHDEMNEEHDKHHDEEEEDKEAEEHEKEEHDEMNHEHDEHHDEEEEDKDAMEHEKEEHDEMNEEHDHEEGHHHHDEDDDDYEQEMDDEEKRQKKFHDNMSASTLRKMRGRKRFDSLEKPHNGIEKFQDNGEEIDINDHTKEGEFDQMLLEKKLEDDKNLLPMQDVGEHDMIDDLKNSFKPYNAKTEADEMQNKMYEQNQDSKLEGSDHSYYHDQVNSPEPRYDDVQQTHNENSFDDSNKRHDLNLIKPVSKSTSSDNIVESPHNEEEVDKKLIGDFKSRFNEETSFQSVEQAEELFNHLQDAALQNQKAIDSQQTSGSVTDNGLVSHHFDNTLSNNFASKRQSLYNINQKLTPAAMHSGELQRNEQLKDKLQTKFFIANGHNRRMNIPQNSRLNKFRKGKIEVERYDGDKKNARDKQRHNITLNDQNRHDLFFTKFFVVSKKLNAEKNRRKYNTKRAHFSGRIKNGRIINALRNDHHESRRSKELSQIRRKKESAPERKTYVHKSQEIFVKIPKFRRTN